MAISRRGRRPEAECAVDVDPRPFFARASADLRGRIERTGVDVPCLEANDRPVVEDRQRVDPHPTLSINRYAGDALMAESEQRQRLQQRDVNLVADNDASGGAPNNPSLSAFQPARSSSA